MDLKERFNQYDDDYIQFKRVQQERRLSNRPDLCAFLLLDKLVPGGTGDMVACAAHDEIWLDTNVEALAAVATDEDIQTLVRCGVRYDSEVDSLAMFA